MDLIVTVVAEDRPGVIEQVASVVAEHRGSWQESRMAQLGGSFAGIISVRVPDADAQALRDALAAMPDLVAHIAVDGGRTSASVRRTLQVVANDRPGIIAEVSHALAAIGVNVTELTTSVEPASMSGGTVFRAAVDLGLVGDQRIEDVVAALERLSADLMVDVLPLP